MSQANDWGNDRAKFEPSENAIFNCHCQAKGWQLFKSAKNGSRARVEIRDLEWTFQVRQTNPTLNVWRFRAMRGIHGTVLLRNRLLHQEFRWPPLRIGKKTK